jgi:hypothetical protein
MSKELLERIVFAQNRACTCLTKTPDPEWHSAHCAYRTLQDCEEAITELTRQRDELLAALEAVIYFDGDICSAALLQARKAIARVKGGAA